MSDTTTSGDRGVVATVEAIEPVPAVAKAVVGRSPGQLAWARLKRDKVAVVCGGVLALFALSSILAPVIGALYGQQVGAGNSELLDMNGRPLGQAGGVSGDHWLGLTPARGYDVFLQLVYGVRTSLGISLVASITATVFGVVVGIVSGYLGGWVDRVLGWFTDVFLCFPFFLFALALVPTLSTRLEDTYGYVAPWKRIGVIIMIFVVFGWMYVARLVRGQVISLREREYVEAARAAGAGTTHILFRQLLPNIWAPILVAFSLQVPAIITAEAALAIFGIGITEDTGVADLGRLIVRSMNYLSNPGIAPGAIYLPGLVIFILVLAFNLFGDSLRDALDPKSSR